VPHRVKNFITGLLRQTPEPQKSWTPPPFHEADHHPWHFCESSIVPFGRFNDTLLELDLCGHVAYSEGDVEEPLIGRGILKITIGLRVKQHVQVTVLGVIVGTGTAVLLDREGAVWLYNPPGSVDPHLNGLTSTVSLVMWPGDKMAPDQIITIFDEYQDVCLQRGPPLRSFRYYDEIY
jgi:hypothetical protein